MCLCSAQRCRREAVLTGRCPCTARPDGAGVRLPAPPPAAAPQGADGPAGTRFPRGVLPTWRGPAAEGRSFPGRQSERRLPFARANQRPGNARLNPVPGNCGDLRVTGRGQGAAPRANQRRGSGYRQAVKPMGLRRGARRLPAERLVSAGELLGDRRGSPAAGGSWAPGRAAAAVMAKGARARRREGARSGRGAAGPGRGGLSRRAGTGRRGVSPRRGGSSREARGAGAGGTPPPRGVRSSPGRGWAAAARPAASSPLNMAQAAAAGR